MNSVFVTVKWGSHIFSNVEIKYNQTGLDFKNTLHKITNVLPSAQSVISKNSWTGLLKDDFVFTPKNVKPDQTIILIGITAEENTYRFSVNESDMTVENVSFAPESVVMEKKPAGLANINNSCYINSVIQVVHQIPELVKGIEAVPKTSLSGRGKRLLYEIGEVYRRMDASSAVQMPMDLCKEVRMAPQFGQQDDTPFGKAYKQQDADEFFSYVLSAADSVIKASIDPENPSTNQSFVDQLFGYTVNCEYKCNESDELYYTQETLTKLFCNIDGGVKAKVKVNTIYDGIKLSQETQLEKYSEALGRNAVWTKTSTITELPRYFYIQLMRFTWKEDDRSEQKGEACKIMRRVDFPDKLDAIKLLESEKAKLLQDYREAIQSEEVAENLNSVDDKSLKESICASVVPYETPLGPQLPITFYGKYSLVGAISHMGEKLDGGHYNAWIRNKTSSYDQWYRCDDDTITSVLPERIKNLRGGSYDHSAYILIYKADDLF